MRVGWVRCKETANLFVTLLARAPKHSANFFFMTFINFFF